MNTQDSTLRRKRASTSFGSPLLSFRPKFVSRWGNIGEILKFPRDLKASQSFQFWLNQKIFRTSESSNFMCQTKTNELKHETWAHTHLLFVSIGQQVPGEDNQEHQWKFSCKPNSFSSYNNWVLHALRKRCAIELWRPPTQQSSLCTTSLRKEPHFPIK